MRCRKATRQSSSGTKESAMSAGAKTLEQRIAMVIRLLASDKDGEIIAAVHALKRTLRSAGTENRLHGADEFIDSSGKPTWQSVALFCQRNKQRLDARHHQFIDDMASRTVWDREPTEKQHKYLFALFLKLGGKII
jgi:hypothetical protein